MTGFSHSPCAEGTLNLESAYFATLNLVERQKPDLPAVRGMILNGMETMTAGLLRHDSLAVHSSAQRF